MAKPTIKRETLPASLFYNASAEAKTKLCHQTLGTHPHFCWDLACRSGASFPFQRYFSSDSMRNLPTLAIASLGRENLALARLFFGAQAKSLKTPQKDDGPYQGQWRREAMEKDLEALYSGPASDAKANRARSWIKAAHAAAKTSNPSVAARELWSEAAMSFAFGRPAIGLLRLCDLAKLPPESIANASFPIGTPWPDIPSLALGARLPWATPGASSVEKIIEAATFSKALPQPDRGSFVRQATPSELSACSPLALASWWISLLNEGAKALPLRTDLALLAKDIEEAADHLWRLGAASSPQDYADRFDRMPLQAGSPQIATMSAIKGSSVALATVAPAWRRAAERPCDPLAGTTRWDAFVKTHESLGVGIQENPFAATGGQTPALWSIAGDATLIRLGLERGFDPKAGSRLLLEPGASAAICNNPKTLGASIRYGAIDQTRAMGSASAHCLPSFRGAPAKAGSPHKNGWLYSNLATACALAGHMDAAHALAKAGCDAPDAGLACTELDGSMPIDEIAIIQSRVDALAIKAMLAASDAKKSSKAKKQAPAAEPKAPEAPKRRILKA